MSRKSIAVYAATFVVLLCVSVALVLKGDEAEATQKQQSIVSDMAKDDAIVKAMLDLAMKDGALSQSEAESIISKNALRMAREYSERLEGEIAERTNAR